VTYAYNEVGERTKATPEKGGASTYGYDQAGNLISVERPEKESVPKIEDTYAYNGEDLRTSQTISGTTSYLAWDMAEEIPLILSDGTNSYIYGPGGLPVEQISSGGTVTYLHHDQAGSTRLLTGSTGTVTGKCTYGAYGATTCEGATTTPLGYEAQYTSSDTGLIYMRARTYDPATGQFLSVDPLTAITRAPYNYAGDSPPNAGDPTGLFEIGGGWSQEVFGNLPGTPIGGSGGVSGLGWFSPTSGSAGTTGTGAVRGGVGFGGYVSGPVVSYSNGNSAGELTGPFTELCAGASLLVGAQVCVEHGHAETTCGEKKPVTVVIVGPTLGLGANIGGGKSYTEVPHTVDQDPIPEW
jgi:RHS repeat-associated protein